MPVDMSMVGLQGIAAADASADSAQARLQSVAQIRKMQNESALAERDMALDQQAATALQKLQSGDAGPDASNLFKGVDQSENGSAAEALEVVGNVLIRGGSIKRGQEALTAASNIRRDEALNERNKYENAKDQVETVLKTANVVAQTVGVARNESEWRYGLAQLREAGILPPEQLDALDAMEYDEDVVSYLNEQATTAYQRAQLDLTASRDATNKRQADARISNSRNLTEIAEGRLRIAEETAARAAKNGKSATAPNTDEIRAATAAITNQIYDGKPPKTKEEEAVLKAGAVSIASRTRQLLRENQTLSFETAQNQAILESQAAGDWQVVEDDPWYAPATRSVKFQEGKTPANALPLPQTAEGKPDQTKLVKGKYYITAKGKAKWTGSGFELMSNK